MIGCGPGQSCCERCRAQVIAAPVNLGELGNPLVAFAQAAATAAAAVATVKSSKDNKKAAKYAAEAASIEAQSQSNILKLPLALAGIGAVGLALLLRR